MEQLMSKIFRSVFVAGVFEQVGYWSMWDLLCCKGYGASLDLSTLRDVGELAVVQRT